MTLKIKMPLMSFCHGQLLYQIIAGLINKSLLLKVGTFDAYEAPGCAAINILCIRLQGRWLEELGFRPGNSVIVEEGSGGLVIELVRESDESKNYIASK